LTCITPAIVDTESNPEEAPSKIKESLLLVSKAPLTDEKFEALEPSDTKNTSSHSSASLDSTTSLSPDHLLTQTSPTPTPTRVSFHHRISCMTRYRSSYETPSPSPSPSLSLTLPTWKRYHGKSELIEDTEGESSEPDSKREGSEDETSDSEEEEEAALKDQQVADGKPKIPERTTWIDPEDSTGYLDIEIDPRSCEPV
nr:hypothetical protein [Tanacetum cinerariifolium]